MVLTVFSGENTLPEKDSILFALASKIFAIIYLTLKREIEC